MVNKSARLLSHCELNIWRTTWIQIRILSTICFVTALDVLYLCFANKSSVRRWILVDSYIEKIKHWIPQITDQREMQEKVGHERWSDFPRPEDRPFLRNWIALTSSAPDLQNFHKMSHLRRMQSQKFWNFRRFKGSKCLFVWSVLTLRTSHVFIKLERCYSGFWKFLLICRCWCFCCLLSWCYCFTAT